MTDWNAERYGEQLRRGLQLAGESADYFATRRVELVSARCKQLGLAPRRVLELGCGTGNHLPVLAARFASATIVGLDTSPQMVAHARARHACDRIEVTHGGERAPSADFDLAFVNGVFHHVEPAARKGLLETLRAHLRPRGWLAVFDNNPLNPGAMWVMRRIEFDRDARPLRAGTLSNLARSAGFTGVHTRSHFYFPRALAALRACEPLLSRLPLGAQYVVYGQRPA
jgi:SAM-dependent methyltransferase